MATPSFRADRRFGCPKIVLVFLVFLLLYSLPFWAMGAALQFELLPGIPFSALMVVCPAMAALTVHAILRGWPAAVAWLRRVSLRRRRAPAPWLTLAVIAPLGVVAVAIAWKTSNAPPALPGAAALSPAAVVALTVLFLCAAWLEELGWSACMTVRLKGHGHWVAGALVTGGAWALWHWIPLLQAGRTAAWIVAWMLMTIALRVVIAWLFLRSGRHLWVAVVCHAAANLGWQLLSRSGPGFDPAVLAVLYGFVAGALVLLGLHRSSAAQS